MGIIFSFVITTINPITFGINIKNSKEQTALQDYNRYLYSDYYSYYLSEISNFFENQNTDITLDNENRTSLEYELDEIIEPLKDSMDSTISMPRHDINREDSENGFLFVTLKSDFYRLTTTAKDETEITMEGYGSTLVPGCPKLPSKVFYIGVPPGAEVISIELISEKHEMIPGSYSIVPAPPITNGINPVKYEINEEIYSSSDPYPPNFYEYLGMGQLRKYSFAQVRFSPISYFPASGKLKVYNELIFKIEYKIIKALSIELLADNVLDEVAAEIIFNYPSIYQYYNPSTLVNLLNTYNYVIITTSSLENSINPLKEWREKVGYSVKVVNISWISSQYSGWDLVEKIRNFLIDKYAQWSIKYVLIVGNHSSIPMRYCYPNKYNHNDDGKTPTDYYYADLTGDWDSDGDLFYGERIDDSPDFNAEIWVGRIPINTPSIVENICQRTIDYERNNGTWKKRILSCGPFICFENEDYTGWSRTDHATVMEELWNDVYFPNNYSRTTMYEKAGLDPSTYLCNHNLSRENVTTYWPDGYGIVNLDGHGNPLGVYRKWWGFDDGDGVPEAHEIYWEAYFSSYDNISLNNNKPSIVFSVGCKTIFPEYQYNLGKSLLINGSIAYVGATRSTWLRAGWENENSGGCQSIEYYFFEFLMNQSQTCAEALYNSKLIYKNYFDGGGWSIFQNLYNFCLYGDPTISLITYENHQPDTPSIDGPTNGKAGKSYQYNFTSTDPDIDDIAEYIVKWGDNTPEEIFTGPFASGAPVTANHTWSTQGTYIIKVKAVDIYRAESDWAELEVSMTKNKATTYLLLLQFLEQSPALERILSLLIH